MASNRQWAEAMSDRLWEGMTSEYDQRTKDLIIQAFLAGLAEYPQVLEDLKSSSLIESNYFDDEQPDERTIEGQGYKIRIKMAAKKR
jgi:hypothetical protein